MPRTQSGERRRPWIGERTERVTIQAPAVTKSDCGEPDKTWTDLETVWASIEHLTGREYWEAQQVQGERTLTFTFPYWRGLGYRHRLSYDSRYFDIKEIDDVGNKHAYHRVRAIEAM